MIGRAKPYPMPPDSRPAPGVPDPSGIPAAPPAAGPEPQRRTPVLVLQVLSGVHAGASVPLASGRYLIGREDVCDFIFCEEAFGEGTLLLDLSGEKPLLTASPGLPVQVQGHPLKGLSQPLSLGDTVAVGFTAFSLEAETAAPASGATGTGKDPGQAPPAQVRKPLKPPAPPRISQEAAPAGRGKVVLLGLAALLLPLAFWLVHFLVSAAPDPEAQAAGIRRSLSGWGFADVRVQVKPQGLLVTGHVPKDKQKETLMAWLATQSPPPSTALWSVERTLQSARQVFELYQVDLQAAIGPGGRLEVRGALDDGRRVEEILAALKQDVSGIASLENRVRTSADLYAFFSRELARHRLVSKVSLEMDRGSLQASLLKDKFDSADAGRWKQVKAAARRELGLEVRERWTDLPSPILLKNTSALLELDQGLMAVHVGEVNRITLRNGKKFLEGARLRSGRVIKSIRQDRIVLEKDGREEIYYLKGRP